MPTVSITNKTHKMLSKLVDDLKNQGVNIYKEALLNIILILALNDENLVKQAVNLIRNWNLNEGATDLERKHGL
jgi:hypothetical protein